MLKIAAILLAVIVIAVLAYIRLAPSRADVWHVDPLTAKMPKTPNAFILRPGYGEKPVPEFAISAAALAQKFDAMVMSEPRVSRLAGSAAELWVTYLVRTKWMGYPDYVSVKFVAISNTRSTLAIFSRSRFGKSDLGVNRARVQGWLVRLQDGT
ncbi:MAG: DUF1499 domain-containing protein [Alphaproteobacteria bacterium]|nr:DUF1499 domain-containing protein [Alphaproteobacteria bacterium]